MSHSASSYRRQPSPLKLVIQEKDILEIIQEAQIVHVLNIPELPDALPETLTRKRRILWRRLAILATHENLLRLNGPAGPGRLDGGELLSVGRHAALEGEAVVHVGLPVGPLEGLVGGGAAVDEVDCVGEETPDHGGEHPSEDGDGAKA